jgi:hypothetical protein
VVFNLIEAAIDGLDDELHPIHIERIGRQLGEIDAILARHPSEGR